MKKFSLSMLFLACLKLAFSQNSLYEKMLEYRLQNSTEFKQVQNEAQIAENAYKQQILNSYIITEIGTGGMTFDFTEKGTNYNLNPNAKITLPSFSNLGFNVAVPFSKAEHANSIGANFGLSFDIYSQSIKSQRLQREQAERVKNAATEKLKYSEQIIQRELLQDSQKILNEYMEYLQKQLATVTADISFRRTELEGYSKNSVRYKAAQLKALAAEKQAFTSEKIFMGRFEKFFVSCGFDKSKLITDSNEFQKTAEKFFSELCFSIPKEKSIDTRALNLQNLKQFKHATENYQANLEQRKIQNSNFTLSGSLGYAHNKTTTKLPFESSTKTDSLSGGLNFAFPGGSVFSGLSFNLGDKKHPSLNLAITLNPLEIYYKKLAIENAKLQDELDAIAFKNETEKCEQLISDTNSISNNLNINFESAQYEYEIYQQNANDIKKLFEDGFTTKLDNQQARLEYLQALINYAQAKMNIVIFNIETLQAFDIPSEVESTQAKNQGEK